MTVRVLKTILGAVMMLVAAIGIFLIIGYAVTHFGDLGRRVSDGNGYEAVVGTAVIFGMLGVAGYFLIDWGGLRAAGTSTAATIPVPPAVPRPRNKRVGVVLAISASVLAAAVLVAVAFKLVGLLLLLLVPQIALVVVTAVMGRTARIEHRRPYRVALVVTAIVNALTILAVFALIALARGNL